METYIQEETFFKYLTWVCHTLCGLCISMLVGDNFLFNEYDSSIIQRSCAKLPKWILMDPSTNLAFKNIHMIVNVVLIFICLAIKIVIFLKQRQLKSQQSAADFFVTYNTNDVKIVKQRKQPNCILWRLRRNVISPIGSFSSFLASVVYNISVCYIFLHITPSGPSVIGELLLFSVHAVYFFCLNLIESIFSPTLRNSIINVLPWSRHEYNSVVV